MALYKNKYRIEPARLKDWDYSSAGAYFVTICTRNRDHFFGNIKNDCMILNEIGSIVEMEWIKTPALRADMNLTLDEYMVMPNHFHGIIFIGDNEYNRRDAMHCVSTMRATEPDTGANKFGPQSKNLGSIARGFKSSVTTQARIINAAFCWQTRYHDHIIRDHASFLRIQHYIINNVKNWKDDKFFGE